jgi:hypothetical protein
VSTDTAEALTQQRDHPAASTRLWPLLILWLAVPAVIAALMAWYLVASRRVVGEFGFPLDDSWIHLRFAQNLARGHGFSFNPGQPASTTTAPLWTLLLALGYRVTGEHFFTSAALNWILCCLCAGTVSSLVQTFVPSRNLGAAAALIFAVTIPLPWFALSGMEPPLFIWLTLLGMLLHVRHREARGIRALTPTLVFGFAALARPECLLLFPLAMLDRLLMARHEATGKGAISRWLKQLALHLPVFTIVVAPMFIYNYRVIGRLLPSSFYIKAMNYGITWALGTGNDGLLLQCLLVAPAKEIVHLLGLWAGNNIVLMAPFLVGVGWTIRRASRRDERGHRSFLMPLVLIAQPVAWAIATNFNRAPSFQSQRYVANLGPLYLIMGVVGAWWLVQWASAELRRAATAGILTLAVMASLVGHRGQVRMYSQNVKNITELQVTTARWIRDHLPQEAVLAANDVGAIAVITGCRVHDMMGLVSPETLACLTLENARRGMWRQCVREAMVRARPDYMVVNALPKRMPGLLGNPDLAELIYDVEIEDNITAGGSTMVVFRTVWCKYGLDQASRARRGQRREAGDGLGEGARVPPVRGRAASARTGAVEGAG